MPIFRRDSESPEGPHETGGARRPAQAPVTMRSPAVTRLAPGSQMVGEITGSANVVIEGDLQGEVRIEGKVRVEPGGRVRGGLQGGELEVAGRVHGDVVGRERITLDASAELYGNLSAPRVVIHEGALFKGQVEMGVGAGGGRRTDAEKPRAGQDRKPSPASPEVGPEAGPEGGTA